MDNPDRKKRKKLESKPVEIRTTNKRLDKLRDIYQSGKVRSVAHDKGLLQKLDKAKEGKAPQNDDGYKDYKRVRGKLGKDPEFKEKEVHHNDYPRKKFPKESLDPQNLLLTDKETHKDLHRATGGKGWDMYRKKEFANHENKGVRDSVKDYFNFQNPQSRVPLEEVKEKLKAQQTSSPSAAANQPRVNIKPTAASPGAKPAQPSPSAAANQPRVNIKPAAASPAGKPSQQRAPNVNAPENGPQSAETRPGKGQQASSQPQSDSHVARNQERLQQKSRRAATPSQQQRPSV